MTGRRAGEKGEICDQIQPSEQALDQDDRQFGDYTRVRGGAREARQVIVIGLQEWVPSNLPASRCPRLFFVSAFRAILMFLSPCRSGREIRLLALHDLAAPAEVCKGRACILRASLHRRLLGRAKSARAGSGEDGAVARRALGGY